MFTKQTNLTRTNPFLHNFINGSDLFNSKFLLLLQDPNIEKVEFKITTLKYRPDLIAEEFYENKNYQDLVILLSCLPLSEFLPGRTIKLIPLDTLNDIINNAGK